MPTLRCPRAPRPPAFRPAPRPTSHALLSTRQGAGSDSAMWNGLVVAMAEQAKRTKRELDAGRQSPPMKRAPSSPPPAAQPATAAATTATTAATAATAATTAATAAAAAAAFAWAAGGGGGTADEQSAK
eukprot:scaffold11346_cov50-Phaeocystis_antarctica.AAC.5